MDNIESLVRNLAKLPTEVEYVEFKVNNEDPKMIAAGISALANSAAFHEKSFAYMVWGVHDATHEIVGTKFDYRKAKVGNEELENWLRHQLSRNADFEFSSSQVDSKQIVILKIYPAVGATVMFESFDYIKIGSLTKKLNDYPEIKVRMWDRLRKNDYELMVAQPDLDKKQVMEKLNYPVYFELTGTVMPESSDSILRYLLNDRLVLVQDDGLYSITNMGALLFAKRFQDFTSVSRKALRIVQYSRQDKLELSRERASKKGYAVEFEELLEYIQALLPAKEVFNGALRKTITAYPAISIRETVANALIHQDLSMTGTSPVVEIFSNRIEITNPGSPLIDIEHIIEDPPISRNEKISDLMRRMHICEELGIGWDKIVTGCEAYQLPAPKIEVYPMHTKVTLYAQIPFKEMANEDKIRSCYQHAVMCYMQGKPMNNTSLRERFGLDIKAQANISRLLKDAVKDGVIKPFDSLTAPRYMRYLPYWA